MQHSNKLLPITGEKVMNQINKKKAGLGLLFLRTVLSLTGGALFGVVVGIIFQIIFLQDSVTSFRLTEWAIGGANIGLLIWLIAALIRANSEKYQASQLEGKSPQLEITRGGFKEGRILVPAVRDLQRRKKLVKRMPEAKKDGKSRAQLSILLLVLGVGLTVGTFFGWAELASVFGQFNLIIYGTVAAAAILVIIIAILEQKN